MTFDFFGSLIKARPFRGQVIARRPKITGTEPSVAGFESVDAFVDGSHSAFISGYRAPQMATESQRTMRWR